MSITSPPRPSIIAIRERRASATRSLNRVDDRVRPQRGDDRCQMLHIADLDVDHDLEEVQRAVGELQIADIAALLPDDRGQAAEIAGLVGDRDVDPADMDRIPVASSPRDIEPTLGRIGETLERIAVDRVDGDTLTGGDDADDAVARERVATAGEMQRHARNQTANRYRRLILFYLTPRYSQRDNLALGFLGLREGGVGAGPCVMGTRCGVDTVTSDS